MEKQTDDGLTGPSTKNLQTENEPAAVLQNAVPATANNIPDPDEDDLDDLDDMLDEFTPAQPEPKAPSLPSGPGRPAAVAADPPVADAQEPSDEDFSKQLQAGLADLLGEFEKSPDMQGQFESMLKELGGPAALEQVAAGLTTLPGSTATKETPSTETKPTPKAGVEGSTTEESFQETIKKTMERMRTSGDQATAAATSESSDDFLAEMMKAMQASGLDGGEGSEEDFSKMLLGMMEQLTNKEILYEPMKELDDKFPSWMEKNAGKVPEDDLKRYKEQQTYVREIVARFDTKAYSDDNSADREYIVERMQKMQAAGSPPADLVGDMAAAQEAFGAPEEGCPQQ
ncbi:Uncharacterized protein BP5553_05253 [Venustampulla echinocandica]|uniref:Pex19-domain-containing protein n=1 Tax=Venustampulla echinocandica TaxID=2656787 RepID=A0A370TQM0_9HELO|nr:Uncharacterized protein BP5553_05253 [Venustampulla echinocandica]RDL37820.1 Uncharacterized protein BP5553_05253 [Venustampulla echinocandica]